MSLTSNLEPLRAWDFKAETATAHERDCTRNLNAHAKGFALIELMIGLTIGLLVVIAASASFTNTHLSSLAVNDSLELHQTADAVFRVLEFQIAQAGAPTLLAVNNGGSSAMQVRFNDAFTGFDPSVTLASGQIFAIHGERVTGANNTGADTLRTSRQDDGVSANCLGTVVSNGEAGVRIDSQFFLSGNVLMCRADNPVAQPIAENVEDFQVRYGVRVGAAGANASNAQYQFFTADQITAWARVQAVSICLQIRSETAGLPDPPQPVQGCQEQDIAPDGRLHLITTRLITVRNIRL